MTLAAISGFSVKRKSRNSRYLSMSSSRRQAAATLASLTSVSHSSVELALTTRRLICHSRSLSLQLSAPLPMIKAAAPRVLSSRGLSDALIDKKIGHGILFGTRSVQRLTNSNKKGSDGNAAFDLQKRSHGRVWPRPRPAHRRCALRTRRACRGGGPGPHARPLLSQCGAHLYYRGRPRRHLAQRPHQTQEEKKTIGGGERRLRAARGQACA